MRFHTTTRCQLAYRSLVFSPDSCVIANTQSALRTRTNTHTHTNTQTQTRALVHTTEEEKEMRNIMRNAHKRRHRKTCEPRFCFNHIRFSFPFSFDLFLITFTALHTHTHTHRHRAEMNPRYPCKSA